ncbi:hypothetical protein D3C72_1121570 [compost metagenome]
MTRLTLLAFSSSWSAMTVSKWPLARSDSGDTASLLRSSDFGVMITSGLRNRRIIWRRSRWKICAGVVGCTTCMLWSAQSCRKRSIRAELCSGPWPS